MIRSAPIAAVRQAVPSLVRWIGLAILAGTVLAILGPFGSYLNGGPIRLLGYWVGAMLLGLALYGSAYMLVGTWFVPGSRSCWLALLAGTLLASVPEAFATRAAAFQIWPELTAVHLPLSLWFVQTVIVGLIAMVGIGLVMHRSASPPHEMSAPPPIAGQKAMPLGSDVLALQMEDHYVRVHRQSGTELILMPLARAIEATDTEGLRTHRSWWVARHAVATIEGDARSMRVRLSNGIVAPVARSAVIHLKTAGWFVHADSGAASGTPARSR